VEAHLHALTSALDGGDWSDSHPGRFTPRERAPGTHWIGDWVGPRRGEEKDSQPLPGLEPPSSSLGLLNGLFPLLFSKKLCMHLSILPYVLHAPPIFHLYLITCLMKSANYEVPRYANVFSLLPFPLSGPNFVLQTPSILPRHEYVSNAYLNTKLWRRIGGVEVSLHESLTSALDECEWSDSRPGHITRGVSAHSTHWTEGWADPRGGPEAMVIKNPTDVPAGNRTPAV
jgi:hypothetical protein